MASPFRTVRSRPDQLSTRIATQLRRALEDPCYLAIETMHPRLRWAWAQLGHTFVLSVNAGYE
jgi:hypothetical protein